MPNRSKIHGLKTSAEKSQAKRESRARYEQRHGSARQRGYNWRWQLESKAFLAENPLCRRCSAQGLTVPATLVDHITPHKGNPLLFWDRSNWQPLCVPCHGKKTVHENMAHPPTTFAPTAPTAPSTRFKKDVPPVPPTL
jgi:5-methylcytosine-specific restriction protein A